MMDHDVTRASKEMARAVPGIGVVKCTYVLSRGVGWGWAMGLRSPMAVTLWGRVWVCAGCGFVGIWRGGRGVDGAMWDFWVGWVWVYDTVATWRLGVP